MQFCQQTLRPEYLLKGVFTLCPIVLAFDIICCSLFGLENYNGMWNHIFLTPQFVIFNLFYWTMTSHKKVIMLFWSSYAYKMNFMYTKCTMNTFQFVGQASLIYVQVHCNAVYMMIIMSLTKNVTCPSIKAFSIQLHNRISLDYIFRSLLVK